MIAGNQLISLIPKRCTLWQPLVKKRVEVLSLGPLTLKKYIVCLDIWLKRFSYTQSVNNICVLSKKTLTYSGHYCFSISSWDSEEAQACHCIFTIVSYIFGRSNTGANNSQLRWKKRLIWGKISKQSVTPNASQSMSAKHIWCRWWFTKSIL